MPFVLPALASLMLGLLSALMSTNIDWLFRQIAKAIGDIDLAIVKIPIGKWFYDAASAALGWCVGSGVAFFGDLQNWIFTHDYLVKNFAFHATEAIHHSFHLLDHVSGTMIPGVKNAAEAYTDNQVGAAKVDLKALISTAESDAQTGLADFTKLSTVTIPADLKTVASNLSSAVGAGVTKAENYTDSQIATLQAYVDAQVTAAEQLASDAVHALAVVLTQSIGSVAATAQSNLLAAEGLLGQDITAVANTETADVAALKSTITGDISTVTSKEQADIAAAEAAATQQVSQLGTTLSGTITSDVSQLQDTASANAAAAAGDVSALGTSLTAAIAAAVGTLAVRVSKLEECSVGVCSDSPNNFDSLLQDALGIAEFASVFAFLSSAISNPASAEQSFSDVVQGLYQTGDSLFDSLLSL